MDKLNVYFTYDVSAYNRQYLLSLSFLISLRHCHTKPPSKKKFDEETRRNESQ